MFFKDIARQIITPLVLLSCSAWGAEGGISGGGGDVVVLPSDGDDRVLLADPWRKVEAPVNSALCYEPFALPEDIIKELRRADFILQGHDVTTGFIDKQILAPSIRYCLVEELPSRRACRNRMEYANLPPGAQVEPVACTDGYTTWVIKKRLPSMSIREQALLYVHEGMRRIHAADDLITDTTDALAILLESLNLQMIGEKPSLSQEQKQKVLHLHRAVVFAGMTAKNPQLMDQEQLDSINKGLRVHDGGGLVSETALLAPSAYVGAGVVIYSQSKIGPDSTIVASRIHSDLLVESRVRIAESSIWAPFGSIGDDVTIEKSTIHMLGVNNAGSRYLAVQLEPGVRILSSSIAIKHDAKLYRPMDRGGPEPFDFSHTETAPRIMRGARIEHSSIEFALWQSKISEYSKILRSKLKNTLVGPETELLDSEVLSETRANSIYVGKQSRLELVSVENREGVFQIGDHVSLRNIPKTVFEYRQTFGMFAKSMALAWGTLGLAMPLLLQDWGMEFHIVDGTAIDALGQPVCAENEVIRYAGTVSPIKVKHLKGLRKRCH